MVRLNRLKLIAKANRFEYNRVVGGRYVLIFYSSLEKTIYTSSFIDKNLKFFERFRKWLD